MAGLIAIKHAGGVSIAQSPAEARQPSMPERAIRDDDVDAVLPVDGVAKVIPALAAGEPFELRRILG